MTQKFELPKLPYSYDALEPVISSETLKVHHDKHHQAYTDKFNAALEAENIETRDIKKIFANVSKYSPAIRNHGGGYFNHIFYFESLAGKSSALEKLPNISKAIKKSFGSFDKFKEEFANKATLLFGSGWTWLAKNEDGSLKIYNTPNQDNCFMDIMNEKSTPLLVIDVWEHAYYIDYQNRRPEHIGKFFDIINWDKVEERYKQ
ncbi:MAG: superoxide dismutase [Nanoarchaeota archaeon]|nr:superoxide dismutase [Nanoarchaeota archaeon]